MAPRFRAGSPQQGFTLVELLVVMLIIAILMGLLFPVIAGIRQKGRETQATTDVMGLVNAVKAYQTEYGRYPLPAGAANNSDYTYGVDGSNADLMRILMAKEDGEQNLRNPRKLPFIEPPLAKAAGRHGVDSTRNFSDPWGAAYRIRIDADYDNEVTAPDIGDGEQTIDRGIIAWSPGPDDDAVDDTIVSWQ